MRKTTIIFVVLIVLSLAGGGFAYHFESNRANKVSAQNAVLQNRAQNLQKQYESSKAAANISTASWKQFCDQQVNYCFKYPSDWTFTGGLADKFGYLDATVVSPDKNVTVSYTEPLVKDGSNYSEHIVSLTDKTLDGTALQIIGSYPVSSGAYFPNYIIVAKDTSLKAGTIGLSAGNGSADIGSHQAIAFNAGYTGPKMTSAAQAEAWFNSIEGKTAEAILASYGDK